MYGDGDSGRPRGPPPLAHWNPALPHDTLERADARNDSDAHEGEARDREWAVTAEHSPHWDKVRLQEAARDGQGAEGVHRQADDADLRSQTSAREQRSGQGRDTEAAE